MDPVTMSAIASGVGGLGQFASSEQARRENAKQRRKLDALVDNIQDPNFDPSQLTPEEYELVAQYRPEIAQYVESVAPEVVKQSQDMALGRRAQREALERLSGISQQSGIDPQMQAMANEAARRSQIEAQSRQRSILQDAERRGQLGSAATVASQLLGASEGMDRAAQTQNQLAAQAYQDRLNALQQSGSLGRQLAADDMSMQRSNADIINQFNARNTQRRQDYLNQSADTRNQAQMANIAAMQDISNRNIGNRNTYGQYNQQRADEIERAKFNSALQKANIKTGIGAQNMQANAQAAADRNAAIQGAGNIFTGYAQGKAAESAENKRQDREDRRERFRQTGVWE